LAGGRGAVLHAASQCRELISAANDTEATHRHLSFADEDYYKFTKVIIKNLAW